MDIYIPLSKKAQHLHASLSLKLSYFTKSLRGLTERSCRLIIFHSNPLWIQLFYFISISAAGFLALKILKPKYEANHPTNLDLVFMSVSATTVSSMGTVEMEDFTNSQLWVLTLLMLVGGEVFTSMIGLQFLKTKFKIRPESASMNLESTNLTYLDDHIESSAKVSDDLEYTRSAVAWSEMHESVRYLRFAILGYLIVVNVSGSILVSLYMCFVTSARDVLKRKGIPILVFSVFTAVSSFGNCGFIPTSENIMIFKRNSGLLLLIIPQVLAGNTLFPPFLRLLISVLEKITKREEFNYILRNPGAIGYKHFFSGMNSAYLASTVLGFIVVQLVLFCSLEWNSEALRGLNSYQKIVGALFQSVNSRHAGESVVDISALSPAILVLYMLMMYLPPYTSFIPIKDNELPPLDEKEENKTRVLRKSLIFSWLSYLLIFIIERKAMLEDPLNFNVFNIAFEVISAYGNVGFSLGYSCQRLLKPDSNCKDSNYGFAGRWSNKGKMILIVIMICGRLKKFNMEGGKAWKLIE